MDQIIKYQLFGEFCNKVIYGSSLKDALEHAGEIMRPGHYDCDFQKMIPGEVLGELSVIGVETTENSTRGIHRFERVIIQTSTGQRLSVDAINRGEISVAR